MHGGRGEARPPLPPHAHLCRPQCSWPLPSHTSPFPPSSHDSLGNTQEALLTQVHTGLTYASCYREGPQLPITCPAPTPGSVPSLFGDIIGGGLSIFHNTAIALHEQLRVEAASTDPESSFLSSSFLKPVSPHPPSNSGTTTRKCLRCSVPLHSQPYPASGLSYSTAFHS